jgi:hypothetical protein
VVQVFTATRHHHGREAIEKWFQDRVTFVALSPSSREPLTRDYLNRVITEIYDGVKIVSPNSRIFFLMTGHPFLNSVALYALRRKLGTTPFLLLVYDGVGDYHAFSSDFILDHIVPPSLRENLQDPKAETGSQE